MGAFYVYAIPCWESWSSMNELYQQQPPISRIQVNLPILLHLHTSSFESSYIFNILRTFSHTNHHYFTEPQPSRHAASMWLIGLGSIKSLLWDTLRCELQLQPFASSSVAMVSHGPVFSLTSNPCKLLRLNVVPMKYHNCSQCASK